MSFLSIISLSESFEGYTSEQSQLIDAIHTCENYMRSNKISEVPLGRNLFLGRDIYGISEFIDGKSGQRRTYSEIIEKIGSVEKLIKILERKVDNS